MPAIKDTTRLLVGMRQGDRSAQEKLLEAVYGELRALAGSFFRRQDARHTLQPTALVHEAWMKMVDQTSLEVRDRGHFFAIAATAMRQILIDHARARDTKKRGGDVPRVTIDAGIEPVADQSPDALDVLALDEALTRLSQLDPRQARVVELRVFAGLSVDDTAMTLDVSPRTVELDWRMARAWLSRELAA